MKSTLFSFIVSSCVLTVYGSCLRAAESGFVPLLDAEHAGGWKQSGAGEVRWGDGVLTPGMPPNDRRWFGVYVYTSKKFGDFILRAEFKMDKADSDSGIYLRLPESDPSKPDEQSYQIQIGEHTQARTGGIWQLQNFPTTKAFKIGAWNELEITATGQSYKISVNGKITADCVGNRETSGYIALQTHRNGGGIHFRDIRIKELSTPASLALAVSISKPGESPVETLTQQAPNAMEWALAPLDQAVPGDIRQNLTFLREDLLDEGAKKPKASPEAYTLASKLCDTLLATLQERYLAQGHAEFRNVEANARTGVTSEALEARRSYKMSWPQFAREESQRAELKSQATNNAEVLKELPEKSGSNAPTSAARPLTPSTNNSAKH